MGGILWGIFGIWCWLLGDVRGVATLSGVGALTAYTEPDDDEQGTDPFCGCATTCIAAERLDRQWIGIDLSPLR